MDLIDRFAKSLPTKERTILKDVKNYINWEADRGESKFEPRDSDDVIIRTYLLACRNKGVNRAVLNGIASSLERFYIWLKEDGLIVKNPFEQYDLKWPFPGGNNRWLKHEAFSGSSDEREVARLRALNTLAEAINLAPDVKTMLRLALETMLEVMTLKTAWVSLKSDSGLLGPVPGPPTLPGFTLAATHNLPPSLEYAKNYFLTRQPECNCQKLLRTGRLKQGINVVECSRLKDAAGAGEKNNGLLIHASIPIFYNSQAIGVMNFAAEEWRLLSASDLQFLTAGARQLGAALERARLYDQVRTQHARLEAELELARRVQVSLLPEQLPRIPGYSLAAFWQPAHGTSGDYYNVFKLP
jgi:hypothetical protein